MWVTSLNYKRKTGFKIFTFNAPLQVRKNIRYSIEIGINRNAIPTPINDSPKIAALFQDFAARILISNKMKY